MAIMRITLGALSANFFDLYLFLATTARASHLNNKGTDV
ncbi:exported hypothetical protein [Leuconostoc carnosum]|nr:exported hypothetical protein [Leuconostoc carnosum]